MSTTEMENLTKTSLLCLTWHSFNVEFILLGGFTSRPGFVASWSPCSLGGHAEMTLVQPGNVCGSPGAESLPLTVTPASLVQLALGFADKAGPELASQVHLERRARIKKGQRMQADRPHNSEFCHKKPKLPTKEDIIVMNWAFLFFPWLLLH